MFFSGNKNIQELLKVSNELSDLAAASGLLSWDQETYMPPKGAGVRAFQLATLAGVYHEKLVGRSVGRLIDRAKRSSETIYDKALVREIKWEYEKATKMPKKLVEEISEATSRAFDSWQKAKRANSFESFAHSLERVLELEVAAAKLMKKPGQSIYDMMLDNHEEGLTEREVERVFGKVATRLSDLVTKLTKLTKGADNIFAGKKYEVGKIFKNQTLRIAPLLLKSSKVNSKRAMAAMREKRVDTKIAASEKFEIKNEVNLIKIG